MRAPARLLLGLLMLACGLGCSAKPDKSSVEKGQPMRNEVRQVLDQLAAHTLEPLAQTTDSMPGPKQRWLPRTPAPFPAGRYKAVFNGQGRSQAILAQTEAKVPHFSTVRPGVDVIGGFVQLFNDPKLETPDGAVLTPAELDHLIRILYGKACKPVSVTQAKAIDGLKDRLLAIRFDGQPGIEAYHQRLLGMIDDGTLCRS